MNKKTERIYRELTIMFGFGTEVILFGLSGFLMAWHRLLSSFVLMTMGIILAGYVGLLIKENSIENFKWGLK